MPNYYLDIETTGIDPKKEKIITIQFVRLYDDTSRPAGKLEILKEWSSSEKNIIEEFARKSDIRNSDKFSFIPIGYGLTFEHNFFIERCKKHGLDNIDILNRPFLDLKTCGVIMNNGKFRGSGLDNLTGKPHSGSVIPEWYSKKEYDKIIDYIEVEGEEFVKFCMWLYKELPECLKKFKELNRK